MRLSINPMTYLKLKAKTGIDLKKVSEKWFSHLEDKRLGRNKCLQMDCSASALIEPSLTHQFAKMHTFYRLSEIYTIHNSYTGWRSLLWSCCWWKMYGVKRKVSRFMHCNVCNGKMTLFLVFTNVMMAQWLFTAYWSNFFIVFCGWVGWAVTLYRSGIST